MCFRLSRDNDRNVYQVRGSNALWHQDGYEKLQPWGFYIHAGVDGYSKFMVYLNCSNNKRSSTVRDHFMKAVSTYGWPSRVRGDYGTENNLTEMLMIERWGVAHRAYLRGRAVHNARIVRLWKDIDKDSIDFYHQTFVTLENVGLLNRENPIHLVCLYLVYQPRMQKTLNETRSAWNLHCVRAARNKRPIATYEISKEYAINAGYWYTDPGDHVNQVDALYGVDLDERLPPKEDEDTDPVARGSESFDDVEEEKEAGIVVTDEDEIAEARAILHDMDFDEDDGNLGMNLYHDAVMRLHAHYNPEG